MRDKISRVLLPSLALLSLAAAPFIATQTICLASDQWYSVLHPALNGGLSPPGSLTDGDLLGKQEGLVVTNSQLTAAFVTMPGTNYGLDALDALEPWPGLVAFSTDLAGPGFSAGDLLFIDGSLISNRALLESVFANIGDPALGADHGLDAVDVLPIEDPPLAAGFFNPADVPTSHGFGWLYSVAFSTEEDVRSSTGALLASAGDIIVTPPAEPLVIKNGLLVATHGEAATADHGLDAIAQVFPHFYPGTEETEDGSLAGESVPAAQFFSFEQVPPAFDEPTPLRGNTPPGGPLSDGTTHGDILSDIASGAYAAGSPLGLDALDFVAVPPGIRDWREY